MSRYIDVDKLQETVYKRVNNPAIRGWLNPLINEQPTADVKEVKHGQWNTVLDESILEHYNNDVDIFACSICGIKSKRPTKFCPFCGARMDGGNEE
nr:MAG TPA: Rubrerythrin heme iron peroxidase [Caudoviricetes sp.]